MSVVYEENRLRAALYSAMSYAGQYFGALDSQAIRRAGFPGPANEAETIEYLGLKESIFLDWLQTQDKDHQFQTSAGTLFKREYFKFSKQFLEDWPPFLWWIFNAPESQLRGAQLPQFPQTRRTIVDYDGGKRHIRIKE